MFNRDRVINRKLTKVKLIKIRKVQLISFTITFNSVINRIEFIKVKLMRTRKYNWYFFIFTSVKLWEQESTINFSFNRVISWKSTSQINENKKTEVQSISLQLRLIELLIEN